MTKIKFYEKSIKRILAKKIPFNHYSETTEFFRTVLRNDLIKNEHIIIKMMKERGSLLEYVKEQTPGICLAAVRQDSSVLVFVLNQTEEICLAAVKKNGWMLQYVHNQTPKICMAAVTNDGMSLKYVREQTPEICLAAIRNRTGAKSLINEGIFLNQ
jgi:hypothetical protein